MHDTDKQDGNGTEFEIGLRFYPGVHGLNGFFLGGNIGQWSTDWNYTADPGTPYEHAVQVVPTRLR